MRPQVIKDLFPEISNDDELIKELIEHCKVQKFKKDDVIIDYGDNIEFVPLVISGLLKIIRQGEDGKELLLYFLGSGMSCAASFSCCMTQKRSEIMAVCEEDTTLLSVPLFYANSWMGTYDSWRNFIINIYDSRLFALIDTIDRIAFAKLDEKLLHYLEDLSTQKATDKLSLSHLQIAQDLNVSRESISRLLKKLESQKVLQLGRNEITLLHQ